MCDLESSRYSEQGRNGYVGYFQDKGAYAEPDDVCPCTVIVNPGHIDITGQSDGK